MAEMKKKMKSVLGTVCILLSGIFVGAALLAVVFALPVNEKNMAASYDIIAKEGWYPAIPIVDGSLDTYFHSNLPGVLDDCTDKIMLNTALEPQKENVLLAAMDMNDYDYYWHGYVSVLRPMLLVLDYGEIRTLNGVVQLLLVMLLFLQIYRKKGMAQALMVLTSYCLLMPLAMPFSLQYSWVFYIAVGGALFLTKGERVEKWIGIKQYWFFMILGMCTSFFDLLTYPLFTWGFPLIWCLCLQEDNKKASFYVREVVLTGLWWILGYAGLWVGKWAAGSIILKRNIFERAWYEVFFRLGAEEAGGFDFGQRLDVLYTNWKHYEYKIYLIIFVLWLAWFAWESIRKGTYSNVKNKAYALIACSGIVWYLALANHTGGHHFFTYRIYGVSVLAVLSIFTGSVRCAVADHIRPKLKVVCIWCVCGVLGCGLSLLAREDVRVSNGDRAYRQIAVCGEEVCEMRFTPTFPMIRSIGICAETAAGEGLCILRILDGETILYEEKIPLEKYQDTTYAELPVSWRLKKNYDYKMQISFEGTEKETFLLVSENMDMPIAEYGEASVGEMLQGGQILSGLTYRYRPLSKVTFVFLTGTWCGILMAAYVSFIGKRVTDETT